MSILNDRNEGRKINKMVKKKMEINTREKKLRTIPRIKQKEGFGRLEGKKGKMRKKTVCKKVERDKWKNKLNFQEQRKKLG
jgi:hypothetical protein